VTVHDTATMVASSWYFVAVVVVGQYALSALLMAIVISNFIRFYNEETKLLLNYKVQKHLQRISIFTATFRSGFCKMPPFLRRRDCRFAIWYELRRRCLSVTESAITRYIVHSVILMHFAICCSYHFSFSDHDGRGQWELVELINVSSVVFAALYSLEIAVKLIGGGVAYFWSFKSNRFSTALVVLSWGSIAVFYCVDGVDVVPPVSALMVLRLAVTVPHFSAFWQILKWAQSSLVPLTVIMALVLFTFGLFGKYLFSDNEHAQKYVFGDVESALSEPTSLFLDLPRSMLFVTVYAFHRGNAWTPAVIRLLERAESDWKVVGFLMAMYTVIVVLYSVFFALYIDVHGDWKRVQSISRHLVILQALRRRWASEIVKWRAMAMEREEVRWSHFIEATNLFETQLPATQFLEMLAALPPPIGAERSRMAALFVDLKIPIRRQQARHSVSLVDDEWLNVVNFSDVIHAFTWKLLRVEVTVNLEPNEQLIADWFVDRNQEDFDD